MKSSLPTSDSDLAQLERQGARSATAEETHDSCAPERYEDGLIMHLERDQLVFETSRPVRRAELSARATAGLWALRVFVVLVGLMVIYTFIAQLR
jgi:hypothetical protein